MAFQGLMHVYIRLVEPEQAEKLLSKPDPNDITMFSALSVQA
jgi:hypothetical protein